jgi:uncharacterized damage-inducible protein DinB
MEPNQVLADLFRADARSGLEKYLPRIVGCLRVLSEKEIWWRPNHESNAAGNIVLHLCGNVRQWIICGLGGAPDKRTRDLEFSERGPIPRHTLVRQLKATVREASDVIHQLSAEMLSREFKIQGYRVSGLVAVAHVYEHFAYHTGQIIYLTKLKRGEDLRFTRLPGETFGPRRGKSSRP